MKQGTLLEYGTPQTTQTKGKLGAIMFNCI